jgi:hypothetical protein
VNRIRCFFWVWVIVSAVVFQTAGCATTVSTSRLDNRQLDRASDVGVVLISVGMHDKEPFFSLKHLKIVSYDLFSLNPNRTINGKRLMSFSGEPQPEVYFNLRGHLDNGKYGFIHVTELPAGMYLLSGWRHGWADDAMPSSAGGVIMVPGTPGAQSNRFFLFEVKPRHLNYVGEILTVSPSAVEVNDQFERDIKFALDKKPELSQLPVLKQLAVPTRPQRQ